MMEKSPGPQSFADLLGAGWSDRIPIRRALLSVSDKTGLADLAHELAAWKCELVSSGGTGQVLREAGLSVRDIASFTGHAEAFGGRMKTISFEVESAILFDRQRDTAEAQQLGVEAIDLVVCNLYPFARIRDAGGDLCELVEQIDIGGPTLLRAAAKNYASVAVVTNPTDYPALVEELRTHQGSLSLETRARLMRKAFALTAAYDAIIASEMERRAGEHTRRLTFLEGRPLRYGENAHQQAWWFRQADIPCSLFDLEVLGGKELSYNNLLDIQAAVSAIRGLPQEACAVVKHGNPCGLGQSANQRRAFELAWEGDTVSAFGSILAFNGPLQAHTVEFLHLGDPDRQARKFVEVIVAPGYTTEAEAYLHQHKNLRIVRLDPEAQPSTEDLRLLDGSLLAQTRDDLLYEKMENVAAPFPEPIDEELMNFGLRAVRSVRSNAVVIVRRTTDGTLQLLGAGGGQPNRIVPTRLALAKAEENLLREAADQDLDGEEHRAREMERAYLISDAFFPFPDCVEEAAKAGIRRIFQPGGSISDRSVMEACNRLGLSMVMTGTRHFRH